MLNIITLTIASFLLCATASFAADTLTSGTIEINKKRYDIAKPSGYKLEFISELSRPRLMTFANNGDLFIGSRSGYIYHLKPPYSSIHHRLKFGGYPHSVALRYQAQTVEVFVAETEGLYRATYQKNEELELNRKDFRRIAKLPGGGSHTSRTVAVGSDNQVYVSLGISGNCSNEYIDDSYSFADRKGGVLILEESSNTSELKPYASGLRNPVGFSWHPITHALYASNNGPDHLGYEEPREYFSKLEKNSFHGMPWFQVIDGKIQRDSCIKEPSPRPRKEISLPVATFDARSAPMGVTFFNNSQFDDQYSNDAIVAIHGSWGTKPSGGFTGNPASRRHPKLVRVEFENGEAVAVHDFVTGFQLGNGSRWARPMGVAVGPDGALYFTSDANNEGLYKLSKPNDENAQ